MTDAQPINISILDKDYKVACPRSERIAVITALNMANDLLRSSNVDKEIGQELPPRLKDLENKISRVLEQARQLEI
jgi:cell division protein ZapA (FtsZ GTPase activity inhibitor)